MRTVECAWCGSPFEAQRSTARYCSTTCRSRAHRDEQRAKRRAGPGLVAAVERELREAGALDTFLGQLAMHLAVQTATASDSKELRAVVAQAKGGAPAPTTEDEVDEMARKRDEKRRRAERGPRG